MKFKKSFTQNVTILCILFCFFITLKQNIAIIWFLFGFLRFFFILLMYRGWVSGDADPVHGQVLPAVWRRGWEPTHIHGHTQRICKRQRLSCLLWYIHILTVQTGLLFYSIYYILKNLAIFMRKVCGRTIYDPPTFE